MAEKTIFIYKITCLINNKSYVGRTSTSVKNRLIQHFSESKYVLNNKPLYVDMKKYKRDDFIIEEIYRFTSHNTKDADRIELEFIKKNSCFFPNGYNKRRIHE